MQDRSAPARNLRTSRAGHRAIAAVGYSAYVDDVRAVIRSAPELYVLLDRDLQILEASDAYLAAASTKREDLIGRPVSEAMPGEEGLRDSMHRALTERRPDAIVTSGRGPDRHWEVVNTPILGADGEVRYLLYRTREVTDRVRLARAARRAEQLLDHAPDAMVIVGDDVRIRLVNLQTDLVFGYTRDELLGQPLDALIPERFRATHGGHLSRYFADPVSRPMGSRLELFGRRKDGTELPIEVSLSPQRDEEGVTVSAAIRDISERKRYEAVAKIAADRLHSAVDSIQDAFALFDAGDRLVMCNSAFRRLARAADPERLVGKSYEEVLDAWIDQIEMPDEDARARFREQRIAGRSLAPTTTFDVHLRDGRVLRVVDRRTAEGGIVKTIWDITDDERRAAELHEARQSAEAASAAKSEFLSSMSHELRTPLNAVLGFAQLLLRDRKLPLADRHRERVDHILSSGEHLLRLIDDVLDLSKIEAGRVSVSLESVSIPEVLVEVTHTLDAIAARQKIALHVEPPPAGLPIVRADRTRLAQILMNFGSNAVKYNRPDGAVRISVSTPAPDRVRITMSDTGIGIPREQQAKLFQPFQRAGQETGPIEGTGIGLAITKRLADLMNGTVGFRSVHGQGSDFWIELPSAPEAVAPGPGEVTRAAAARRGASSHLVLCVEDNPANIGFLRDLMSTLDDVELVAVPTAELGIDLARARHPALVLMDINLPGMSGLDALRVLKSDETTRGIPVIALTAAASERDRQHGLEAGFYRYLSKPANVDELIAAIDAALARAA